jgi:hypothetical protein
MTQNITCLRRKSSFPFIFMAHQLTLDVPPSDQDAQDEDYVESRPRSPRRRRSSAGRAPAQGQIPVSATQSQQSHQSIRVHAVNGGSALELLVANDGFGTNRSTPDGLLLLHSFTDGLIQSSGHGCGGFSHHTGLS